MGGFIVDDNNPNVSYSGDWQYQIGSTRQWDDAVHTTFQNGASASITFRATTATVIVTIPPGNGQQAFVDIQLDDMQPQRVILMSSAAAVFSYSMWTSPTLTEDAHTIKMTNRGGSSDLNFSFDRLKLAGSGFDAVVLPPVVGQTPLPLSTTDQPGQTTPLQATTSTSQSRLPSTGDHGSLTSNTLDLSNIPPSTTLLLQQTVTQTKLTAPSGGPDPSNASGISIIAPGGNGTQANHPSVSVGAIVGGTLAGLFLILFTVGICVFIRRRGRSTHTQLSDVPVDGATRLTVETDGASIISRKYSIIASGDLQPLNSRITASNKGVLKTRIDKAELRALQDGQPRSGSAASSPNVEEHNFPSGRHIKDIIPTSIERKDGRACFLHHPPECVRSPHTASLSPIPLNDNVRDTTALDHICSCSHPQSPHGPSSQDGDTMNDQARRPIETITLHDMPPAYLPISRRYSTAV